jgi:hypothetical protein
MNLAPERRSRLTILLSDLCSESQDLCRIADAASMAAQSVKCDQDRVGITWLTGTIADRCNDLYESAKEIAEMVEKAGARS